MTDMHKSDGLVLKTDTKGRVRTPAARRESLLDEFERSGLSAVKFAAFAGIKYQTFAGWAARRRKAGGASTAVKPMEQVRWLEAMVEQAQSPGAPQASAVMMHLPGGARLELCHVQQVSLAVSLLRALEKPC